MHRLTKFSRFLQQTLVVLMLSFAGTMLRTASAQDITYTTREVIGGLNVPWEIKWGPDNWIWFTERPGRLSRVDPESGERKLLLTEETVIQLHEAGMLGFDFHPQFPDSPFVYVAYTHQEHWPARLSLVKYRYTGDSLVDRTIHFSNMRSNYMHVGCRVVIRDGKIYLSVGEVDDKPISQDMQSLNGKILRINLDGSIPEDNPFPGSAIWSLGHRNPQGLVFGRHSNLYSTEHGYTTDDELNLIEPGRNYGWPLVEGWCDADTEMVACDTLNVREPLHSWIPTLGVSGAAFYDHEAFPEWRNSVIVAALKDQSLNRFTLDSSGQKILAYRKLRPVLTSSGEVAGRLRDLAFSPNGRVFVSSANAYGTEDGVDIIYEIIRTGVVPYNVSLIEPVEGAIVLADTAALEWRQTAGDSRYRVQLATRRTFENGEILHDVVTTDTFMIARGLSLNKSYYWRVGEVTSSGPWSEVHSFTIPANDVTVSLESPESLVQLVDGKLELKSPAESETALEVLDVRGSLIANTSCQPGAKCEVGIDALPAGSYFGVITSSERRSTVKFQVVR